MEHVSSVILAHGNGFYIQLLANMLYQFPFLNTTASLLSHVLFCTLRSSFIVLFNLENGIITILQLNRGYKI